MYCAFCKENGDQNRIKIDCTKKGQHERKLNGGSSNKSSFQQNMKKELRTMKKKYQKLKHSTRELRVSRKNTKVNPKKYKKVSSYSSDEESDAISKDQDLFEDSE